MYIKEEFLYMDESGTYIQEKLGLSKKNMVEALDAIYDVVDWFGDSLFNNIMENLRVEIIDLPLIDTLALIGIDDEGDIAIFLNLVHLVHFYETGKYKEQFLLSELSCYEFGMFVFLHEIGHYVNACVGSKGGNIEEKVRVAIEEQGKEYKELNKWIERVGFVEGESDTKLHHIAYKKYRNLKGEKKADSFAFKYLSIIFKDVKKR